MGTSIRNHNSNILNFSTMSTEKFRGLFKRKIHKDRAQLQRLFLKKWVLEKHKDFVKRAIILNNKKKFYNNEDYYKLINQEIIKTYNNRNGKTINFSRAEIESNRIKDMKYLEITTKTEAKKIKHLQSTLNYFYCNNISKKHRNFTNEIIDQNESNIHSLSEIQNTNIKSASQNSIKCKRGKKQICYKELKSCQRRMRIIEHLVRKFEKHK